MDPRLVSTDLPKLLLFFKEQKLDAAIQEEHEQIHFIIRHHEKDEFPTFVRTLSDNALLQILAYFPILVNEECMADTARLLNMINKELDVPGLGLDENLRLPFFRCVIPTLNKQVDRQILKTYLNAVLLITATMGTAIVPVALGHKTFAEMKQHAEQFMREAPQAKKPSK